MTEIPVKYIYNDYMIPWEEQEYHEARVTLFKYQFEKLLLQQGPLVLRLIVDCSYYPENRKFKIIDYTKFYQQRFNRTLEINPDFVREYLLT